ncbi:SPOR domain-containing protein [Bordetella bronchiseptica]|uniref:SPOR domain-containing protein n=1 Tax=Bordetella bronchiseptica TaxID=518 RepID=UPI0004614203|nr:SPOR domain-containing protein [Bordetella bronchiseptica]AWP87055.1 cell division protein [Bordetella bronchiseptica]AWQ12623.1 cell division protein [Bordetella bronchiseptica]AXT87042.1 cell division protein [Bordetella bronchiseptica]KDB80972.1 sporulation and cell division repeat protein [Bordetella bronchiseptica CARE970018BB]KDC96248.1 sporulation and cell division repeat protein [Bordetella bronchiseptica MBORD670]
MATKRKSTRRSKERGSTMYGVLAGLLIGLIVAAAVAFYVTKAPMPFVDRATRQPDQGKLPDPRNAPDPNQGLYGRDGAAGTPPTGPTATAPSPLPGVTPGAPSRQPDDLGALIATLPNLDRAPAPAATPAPAAKPAKPAAPVASATPAAPASGTYFLQAGAYRVLEDAEALRARIILLGLPVVMQRAEVNGVQVNRVRVGPFGRLDDMNRARSRLGENDIKSAVVRQ